MPNVDEFVNPKSMLAPGVAGGMTMAITNAIAVNFNLPRPWLGLAVSGFFAAAAVGYARMRVPEKAFFGVLNTLIIFSVALGTNTLGSAVVPRPGDASAANFGVPIDWVISSAFAQPATNVPVPDGTLIKGSAPDIYLIDARTRRLVPDRKTLEAWDRQNQPVVQVTDAQLRSIPLGAPLPAKRFFSSWIH